MKPIVREWEIVWMGMSMEEEEEEGIVCKEYHVQVRRKVMLVFMRRRREMLHQGNYSWRIVPIS